MGNFSNYWDLTTLFTKLKNKLKSISDKIDDSVSLKTATGNPITLTDAANANAEELLMTIEPIQSGSGDSSPTNVRPISGLTSGEVQTTNGENTNTASITFGQTVYGGSVNFKTGEVTVTHAFDMSNTSDGWDIISGYSGLFGKLITGKAPRAAYAGDNIGKSNIGVVRFAQSNKRASNYPIAVQEASVNGYLTYKNENLSTLSDLNTFFENTPLQVCFELATPTTLTLTPAELELLKGNNTITANGAEISIKYYPDNAIGALAGRVDAKPSTADVDTRVRQSIYELGEIGSYNGNYYGRIFPTETGDADLTLFRPNATPLPGVPAWSPALAWRVKDVHAMIGVGYNSGRIFISGGNKYNGTSSPAWTSEILTNKSTGYLHYISIQRYNNDAATIDVTIPIINNTAATMTKTEILTYLDEHESRIKPIHGMYHNIYQGDFVLPEPIVDFIYTYYEGSEDKKLIFYRFDNDEITVTSTNPYLRIEDRFVVQIMQNA